MAQVLIRKFKDCLYINKITANDIFTKYKNTSSKFFHYNNIYLDKISREKLGHMVKDLTLNAEIKFTQKETDILFNQLYSKGF